MTINETQQQIIREMSGLDDWLEKYQYIIDLGKNLAALDQKGKTEAHAVPGCQSGVWLYAERCDGKLRFSADSDSAIIRGMLVFLLRIFNDRVPADIAAADLFFLDQTGLSSQLSPSRANGLKMIIRRFRELGESFAADQTSFFKP